MTLSFLKKRIATFFSIFSLASCLSCHKGSNPLCKKCRESIQKRQEIPPFVDMVLYSYKDPLCKRLLTLAKYNHRYALYKNLLEESSPLLRKKIPIDTLTMIIPVPTHRKRTAMRGYSHTKRIAFFLSKELTIPSVTTILYKKEYTKRQATLSRGQRLLQQKDSFSLTDQHEGLLKNATVLLVDDIITTGSTLAEARKTLLKGGAKKVYTFAIAH